VISDAGGTTDDVRTIKIFFRSSPCHSLQDGQIDIAEQSNIKADSSRDLLMIFSDRVTVKFSQKGGVTKTLKGRWCILCK